MRTVRCEMSQRGSHLLRVTRQEASEDHLGAGLIRHGDSVIILNEAGKAQCFSRRVEPRDIVPLLPLVAEGLFSYRRGARNSYENALSLLHKRNGTRLEKTSPSADVFQGSS